VELVEWGVRAPSSSDCISELSSVDSRHCLRGSESPGGGHKERPVKEEEEEEASSSPARFHFPPAGVPPALRERVDAR
jgi:hypothetical protein